MVRSHLTLRVAAIAAGLVGTAGVAAAATVGSAPAVSLSSAPVSAHAEAPDPGAAATTPALPDLSDLTTVTVPSASDVVDSLPDLPDLPSVPSVPDLPIPTGSLPVDPQQLVDQITALLPSPGALADVVRGCASDLAALAPVPGGSAGSAGSGGGLLSGLLGSLGSLPGLNLVQGAVPSTPDPAAVTAAVKACVARVIAVLPDPGGLADALASLAPTGSLPAPIADLVAQLRAGVPALPEPGHLLDLVSGIGVMDGLDGGLFDHLHDVLDGLVPGPLGGLIDLPFTVVEQVFATLGL